MNFAPYPFERLNKLISGIEPKKDIIKLTIGEPQFDTPQNIQNELINNVKLLNKYPSSIGESYLIDSQLGFIKRRFGVNLTKDHIIPTFGTRECLFNFPCFVFGSLKNNATKTMAFPNPFYQIYEGSAIASGASIIYMNLDLNNDYKPYLDERDLEKVDLNKTTSIGDMSFENCTKLSSIVLPNTLVELGTYVFSGCTLLNNIKMPSNPIEITNTFIYGSGYYNDTNNWENGILYLDNYLITTNNDLLNHPMFNKMNTYGSNADLPNSPILANYPETRSSERINNSSVNNNKKVNDHQKKH